MARAKVLWLPRREYFWAAIKAGWTRLGKLRAFITTGLGVTVVAVASFLWGAPGWGLAALLLVVLLLLWLGATSCETESVEPTASN